jgi:hypothetical protein
MGRLANDKIIFRLLDEHCKDQNYIYCDQWKDFAYLDPAKYIWWPSSPVYSKGGGWINSRAESMRMIKDSIRFYPWMNIKAAFWATYYQFTHHYSGDGMESHCATSSYNDVAMLFPKEEYQLINSKQSVGQLWKRLEYFGPLHYKVTITSLWILLGVIILFLFGLIEMSFEIEFAAFTLIYLTSNAFSCGVFSGTFNRYQSRTVWIATLATLLLLRPFSRSTWRYLMTGKIKLMEKILTRKKYVEQ